MSEISREQGRLARLTVNYRTPAEIMAATADLLAAIDPGQEPPRSVRETGVRPWRMGTTRAALPVTLEFDSVLIADPGAILAASPRGRNDLYVAMTRSTQRLGVLHPGAPPAEIAALVDGELPGEALG